MRQMKHVALLVSVFFVFTVAVAAEKSQVAISTSSRFLPTSFGQSANVRLIVRMEKHDRNWELEVSCDGLDGGFRTSTTKSFWSGNKQASIYDVGFALQSASYLCEAVLMRKQEDGKVEKFTSSLEVTVH